MLKRFSLLACAGALAFGMAMGCSGDKSAEGSTTAGATTGGSTEKKIRIGVSLPSADHGWTGGALYWAKEATKKYPEIDWTVEEATDSADQINDLDTLMTKGIDAIVILAHESGPLTPKAKELKERGIFIVNVDRGFNEDIADIYLAGDNKAFGKMSADYMVEKLGGKGDILVFRGAESTVDDDRYNTAMEVFKANPGIKVLDEQRGKWNMEESYKVAQSMLTKHPKIDAIWSSDDDMSEGIEKALKEAGRDKSGVWMLGGGGKKGVVKRVMDGDPLYPALVTYPPSMTGQAVDACVKAMKAGKKVDEKTVLIKLDVVTKDNAKDFYFEDSPY